MLKGAGRWRERGFQQMALLFLCFLPCDFATAIARVCVWICHRHCHYLRENIIPQSLSAPTNYTLDFVRTDLHVLLF